jgi:four helix bundle protein
VSGLNKFEDLECWREARKLTSQIYEATKGAGFKRDFRLVSQIQSSSVSVMTNIAEGFTRHSEKEFVRFLHIALSSTAEVMSHLYVALDQSYMEKKDFENIFRQTKRTAEIISGLLRYLKNKHKE